MAFKKVTKKNVKRGNELRKLISKVMNKKPKKPKKIKKCKKKVRRSKWVHL